MKKKFNFLWKGLLMLTCCLFVASVSFAQQWGKWCYKDYSNPDGPNADKSHTFTVPAGCTKVYFQAVGGGGAGGFIKSEGRGFLDELKMSKYYQVSAGGGGGAYGYSDTITGLTPGETFAIKVGWGGRNTAEGITPDEYDADCNDHYVYYVLENWHWVAKQGACKGWESHNNYVKWWHGPWLDGIVGWNGIIPITGWSEWPFYKNRYFRDGGDSYVKRNNNGSMILEAYGGKSVSGDNNITGAKGGAAGGAGAFHFRGGDGGNAKRDCPNLIEENISTFTSSSMWGRISSGGGGAAGNPYGYNPDHRTEAYCSAEDGFGRGGTGYCYQMFNNTGETTDGYGGEGTSDWAWDADGHNGKHGDDGKPKGGAGGGSKIGIAGWCSGGAGGDGFVRVWFYIEDRAITVTPSANPESISGSGSSTITANVSNHLTGSGIYSTSYKWSTGETSRSITKSPSDDTRYCVTVTNMCTYATNSNACYATKDSCVTVRVNSLDPVNVGSISGSDNDWVCNPGDTAVTITSTADATPAGGEYSWQFSTDNSSWTDIDGANNNEYTATATGYYHRGYTYGSSTQYTNTVHVTHPGNINPGMVEDNNGNSQTTVCSGGNVSVNLVANTTYPNITWQTSTDGNTWTDWTDGVTPLTINGITTKTYVRFMVNYTPTCGVPSNSHYTLNVWKLPVVTSISEPVDKCPNKNFYDVVPKVTLGDAAITTYTWSGDAVQVGTTDTGTVIPASLPNCNKTYSYGLKVTDANGCQSAVKPGTFTTENPTSTISSTISSVTAVSDGSCNFSVPALTTLTEVVNNATTSTTDCDNTVTLSNITPAVGDPITTPNTTVTVTATDMCGVAHTGVEITVVKPDAPTVTVVSNPTEKQYLCPGETTKLEVVTTAEEPTYAWTPASLGDKDTARSIAYTGEDVTIHPDTFKVEVTDKYGCKENGEIVIYTTPKAYIANQEHTVCTPNSVTFAAATGDKIPAGSSTLGTHTLDYITLYSWTIVSNTGVTGASAANGQGNFTTGTLTNGELTTQTVTYSVTPTSITSFEGHDITSCDGDAFTVTVNVKPTITTAGAIDPFDDADVIITLWYGACDTLYYVNAPAYTNNTDLTDVLSNNKATVNEGTTLLGRIAPGEYTIIWTVTDECGNHVDFPKKYIVRYPNCGDADPNYTEPYIAVDADGNEYHTVRIGCECWTASNLKTVTGAPNSMVYKCNDYPNETENEEKFGRLYTWYTAVNVPEGDNTTEPTVSIAAYSTYPYVHGICPTGWAIPSTENFTSMVGIAGGVNAVKSSSNLYWLPGAEGNDASGFGARGAGYYDSSAERFMNLMGETYFWTYETSSSYGGKCAVISYYCPELLIQDKLKGMGYSIRCIRRENP